MVEARELVGSKADDPGDVHACMNQRFLVLAPGLGASDWSSRTRRIPNPPNVVGGPFVEIPLALTPAAAVAGQIIRLAASSEQPIWQVIANVRRYLLYRIEAPGVRIMDRRADSKLVGGLGALRREGEEVEIHDEEPSLVSLGATASSTTAGTGGVTSMGWRAVEECFRELIVAVALPDDSAHSTIRSDWPTIASIPRLECLQGDGFVKVLFVGGHRFRMRDLLGLNDASGRPAGRRFARFLARRFVRDLFSPRRRRGIKERAALGVTVLTSVGAIAGLTSQVIRLLG